ncbi:MAG: hypothetical protein ACUVRU_12250 [Anaerolineae bacterium]
MCEHTQTRLLLYHQDMKQPARIQRQPAAGVTLTLDYVRQVKARHEAALLRKANVISVGIGLAPITPPAGSSADPPTALPVAPAAANQDATPRPVLVVGVRRAVALDPGADPDSADDGIPDQIEGVPVTVHVAGDIRAL